MIKHIKPLLHPLSGDGHIPDILLETTIRFGIILHVFASILFLILTPSIKFINNLITVCSILLVYLCTYWLHRKGHNRFSAIFLISTSAIIITFSGLISQDFLSILINGYIVLTIMASLLLGKRASYVASVSSISAIIVIILLHETGFVPIKLAAIDLLPAWLLSITFLIWAIFLVFMINREKQSAIFRASQNEYELITSLTELRTARSALEKYAHDMERRVIQLQVAAEIARDATILLEVDELLERAVNLVKDRFGFYHAGIFMVDDRREYAALKAATGEAGRALIEAGHKLKIGEVGIVGFVTGTGQPRIALDVGSDAAYFRNPNLPETHSEITLPLKTGEDVIGALDVQSRESNAFDDDDIIILQTMADQLAVAIANARLFEATHRQVKELAAIHSIATAGVEARSEDELIERATQMIAEVFFPDNFGVLLLDENTGLLFHHLSYREKIPTEHNPIPIGEGIVGLTIKHRAPCRISDVSKDESYLCVDHLTQSELCVPIKVNERILGVVNAESRQLAYFTADDERLLSTFAGQLGLAIEKIRLLDSERRRVAELEALRLASLHLNTNLKINTVLEVLLDQSIHISAADTAHLFFYDGEKLTFGYASWAEGYPKELHDVPHPNGLTYRVARSGKPIIVTNALTHPIFADHAWNGAVVGMPIFSGSRILGVMNLAYHGGPHKFDEHELRALSMLADQAAIAIVNANMYTEAENRARQLSEALLQRQELDRLKNEFIQNVSHELRTPLAIVHGYTDLLKTGELGLLNEEQLDAVNTLSRRIQFLSELVDDLVVILEAESRKIVRELIPLNEVILGSVHDFQTAAQQAGIKLEAVLPEDIIFIEGNYTHLNRLMDNLIGNAIKFTPPEGSVTVSLNYDENESTIRVSDTGIGIPAEKIEHIFERFYQVDGSTKRRFGGIGLGLALVKEIVNAHGGKISVESQLGKGSIFILRFPLPQ